MSRVVRRFGYAISPNGAPASTFKQAAYLREKVIEFIDSTNAEASTSRRLTRGAAFAVVHRSLIATKDLPFSIREHIAMKDLSQYVTLLQNNKVAAIKPSHTDLLPVAHPRSTKMHTLTASALISARATWYADDSRITDEKAKSVIASAYTATPGSVEHSYYSAMLASLPQGSVPQDILVSLTADGNSSAEKSLRARLQRRDRFGQFAEMFGGMRALIRRAKDGEVYSLSGRPVQDGPNGADVEMVLADGRIVAIPASKGEFIPALIERSKDGFSPVKAKISSEDSDVILNEEDLVFTDAPSGWDKIAENVWSNGNWQASKVGENKFIIDRDANNGKRETIVGDFTDWEDVVDGIAAYEDKDNKPKAELPTQDVTPEPQAELPKKTGGDGEGPKGPKTFAFKYPEGAYKIAKDPDAEIEESYEDPTRIAQDADERDLIAAIEEGLLPKKEGQNATGYGTIDTSDGEQLVPVENLYLALQEMGGDSELEVARIYDKQLGTSENEDALLDSRKQETIGEPTPELDKAFIRETKELGPDIEPATEEPAFDAEKFDAAPLPALLEGLSESELARFMESEDHTSYLPKNEQIEMPIGYASLSPEPYAAWKKVTAENPDPNLPEGFSDNPVFIAQNIPTPELEKEFTRALEPGNDIPGTAKISLKTDSGEEFVADVPGEAVRDALQLQGVDTNALTKKIADEGFEGQKQETVGQEQPIAKITSVEDAIRADEEYFVKNGRLTGWDREKALRDYKQQGPHDPLDPAYKDEFKKDFEEYLYEDGTPNGEFNELLRSNPDFARLFAWNQFDQMASPIHAEWMPSDDEVYEQFPEDGPEDAQHAFIDRLYDAAPTPATAISAGLDILMKPDYFYSKKEDRLSMLKDALYAFKDEDMRFDIKDDKEELAAVESVTKTLEDEIAKLQVSPAQPVQTPEAPQAQIPETTEVSTPEVSAPNDDFEVSSEQEIPDGIEAEPKSPNLEPDNVTGPYRIVSKVSDLQPGDITVGDHFVIESVGGAYEKDPSKLEISGYYPGHVTQNTKKWNASTEMTVIRGAQAPEKGDLPELSKPFGRDFGPVYKTKEGQWAMSKPEDQAKLDAAWDEYNARKAEAVSRFEDPTNKDNTKAPHQVRVKAADLQPGDISAKPEKGHFVIERTFTDETTKPGFVSVEGYYPGHVSQRKEWKVGTDIDVIRNVEAPAKGELPEIHQPSKTNAKGNWVPDKDPAKRAEYEKEIADVASKWEVPKDLPTIEPSASDSDTADATATKATVVKKPKSPRSPTMPAFQGEFAAIAREAGGDWDKFRELIKDREIIFFDYETTGVDAADGNEPWQLGAVKVVNGKIVDRFNVFMNPGRSIEGTYASRDIAGKPNAVNGDGEKLTDEFLGTQPDQKSAHEQFAAWAGENPLLAAHNMVFDDEVARRMADKHGTPYSPAGLLDTLPIARDVLKDDASAPTYAYNGEKDNKLTSLAAHFGIDLERAHSADYDSQATAELFSKLADQAGKEKTGAELFDVDARQADWENAQTQFQTEMADYEQKSADFAAAKLIQDALAGKKVDLDKVIADAKGAAKPNPDGQQESEKSETSTEPAVIDWESSGTYPQGKMKLMPREWAADDANTTLLPREDIRMKDLLPGDFMTSASGDHMYQIVAVRAGEDFGFQAGKVRAYRADLEDGSIHMVEYWAPTKLDGVRRPKNPDDLLLPEDTTDYVVNDDFNDGDSSNDFVPVSTGSATVKVDKSEDGKYKMVATFFDDNGDVAYQVEDSYRTREGAEAEGKALIQDHVRSVEEQKRKEQPEEPSKQIDTPVSRGTVPTGADSAPQLVEVTDLPGGYTGDIQITPSTPDAKKPEFTADASLVDSDGDIVDIQKTTHTSRSEAETTGRDFINRSAEAYSSAEIPEDLGKKSSKPRKVDPERQAELDSIRMSNDAVIDSTGLLPNTRATQLQKGDYIKHGVNKVYEEILEIYQHPTEKNKLLFRVVDPRDGKVYERKFDKRSPITNPRRPGIEDQTTEEANKRPAPSITTEESKGKGRGYGKRSSRYSDRVVVDAAVKLNPKARSNAGYYEDRMGQQIKPADEVGFAEASRVVHVKQGKRDDVGNEVGTIINFSGDQKHGGDVRKGVVYLDFIFVQFPPSEKHPNGVIRKWVANNVMHVGPNGEIPKAFEGPNNERPSKVEYETPSTPDSTERRLNQAFPSESDTAPAAETPKKTKFSDEDKKDWKDKKVEDIKETLIASILADLENGVLPWEAKWKGMLGFFPFNPSTRKQYNGINLFILKYAQDRNGYTSSRWLGKKQGADMGGTLKDGEKPTDILLYQPGGPVFVKDENGNDTKEIKSWRKGTSSFLQVYNVDQFDNLILPEEADMTPVPISEAENEILSRFKDHPPIEFIQMPPGQSPHYSPEQDKITLPMREQYGEDQVGYLKTLFHELAHSTGHKDRLDRTALFDQIWVETIMGENASRGTEELIAEISASMIAAKLGVETDTKHTAAYVKSWLKALRDDREMIFKAAGAASQVLEYVLEGKKPGSGVGKYGKTGEEIAKENKEQER